MAEKLVRNLIPFIILKDTGVAPKMRIATDRAELIQLLKNKLDEEVAELKKAIDDMEAVQPNTPAWYNDYESLVHAVAREAADVATVLGAIADPDLIQAHVQEKKRDRGDFSQLVVVDF
jgi:tetrahydromethanopterin S-methyltransferase subunit B